MVPQDGPYCQKSVHSVSTCMRTQRISVTSSSTHQKTKNMSPSGSCCVEGYPKRKAASSSAALPTPAMPEDAPCQMGVAARLIQLSPSIAARLPQRPGLSLRRYAQKMRPSLSCMPYSELHGFDRSKNVLDHLPYRIALVRRQRFLWRLRQIVGIEAIHFQHCFQ